VNGHVAEPERVEEAIEHAAVALLGDDREAREHQRVEVAVDGAPHHLEVGGEIVELATPGRGSSRAARISCHWRARSGRPASSAAV
jgi:hypothetical protein